jgi:hypothetical protein
MTRFLFPAQTIARLLKVFQGFVTSAVPLQAICQLLSDGPARREALLWGAGWLVGVLAGLPAGKAVKARARNGTLLRLPLILIPVFTPGLYASELVRAMGFAGALGLGLWGAGLQLGFGFVLGLIMGCSHEILKSIEVSAQKPEPLWGMAGLLTGTLTAVAVALSGHSFKGALAINLFMAPLLWPTLSIEGNGSLPIRMLLTMVVALSFTALMFL